MTDLREKVARELCVADRIEPEAAVIVRMKTMRAWESRLHHADRILALPEMEALRLQPVRYLRVGDEK